MLSVANNSSRSGDKFVTKRVLSAKEHRVKQLQNQLADAHFHLSELSNENRLLRSLQKRQDSALQRYENANGDIPKLINSHTEEIRSWQVRYKQLKLQSRAVTQRLKDKDFELQQLRDEHKHLVSLSKDANLIEREKLQNQATELMDKVQKQNEMINTLQRRINLEAKNFKHQLNVEMLKHKETQQQLSEAICHSDQLSSVIEMKEKMIAANIPKKLFPKINNVSGSNSKASLNMFNMENRSKHSLLSSQLSPKGNSSSDSQISLETTTKSSPSSKSMFSVIGKSMQNNESQDVHGPTKMPDSQTRISKSSNSGNESSEGSKDFDNISSGYDIVKAIKDGMPNFKIFESDTEAAEAKSSDDEVRERVEVMKDQLRKQSYDSNISFEQHERNVTYRELRKYSRDSISITSEDSIQNERMTASQIQQPSKNVSPTKCISALRKLEDLDSEIELNMQSLDIYQQSLDNIDGSNTIPTNEKKGQDESSDEKSMHEATAESDFKERLVPTCSEVNNNLSTRKVTTELNSEKKKKLLAALKAIDRGDDDGIHFEGLKKSKASFKGSSSYPTKQIFK